MRRFEDLEVGDVHDCGTARADREEMIAFASTYDPLAVHTDRDAPSPFGGVIASGVHTLALSQRLAVEAFYADSALVAALGMADIRLPTPLRPDRELSVRLEVQDARPSERHDGRGVVTTRRTCETADGVVLDMRADTLWLLDDEPDG